MADPATPSAGTGELTVAQAAERIEGLLGPAPAGKPKPETASAVTEDPAAEPEEVEAEPEAATQPAEEEAEAEVDPSDGEPVDGEPEPAQEQPDLHEVKVNGEVRKVTLDELKKGYSLEAHVTKKTMALADKERAFDAQVQQAAQAIRQRLDTLGAELDRLIPSEKNIDWDALHKSDPAEYVKWKEHFRDLKERRQAVAQEQQYLAAQEQQKAQQQSAETLKREAEALAKKLPVFADPKRSDAAKAELRSYLLAEGYTPEQIGQLSDHRSVTIAYKAAMYDKMQKAKPTIIDKRVVNLPRVQKPGAAVEGDHVSRQKVTSLEQKLRKTGRVQDAAALILAGLN